MSKPLLFLFFTGFILFCRSSRVKPFVTKSSSDEYDYEYSLTNLNQLCIFKSEQLCTKVIRYEYRPAE